MVESLIASAKSEYVAGNFELDEFEDRVWDALHWNPGFTPPLWTPAETGAAGRPFLELSSTSAAVVYYSGGMATPILLEGSSSVSIQPWSDEDRRDRNAEESYFLTLIRYVLDAGE